MNQTQQPKFFRKLTPIGESLSSILARLLKEGVVTQLERQVNPET